jgi:hypothetical protein
MHVCSGRGEVLLGWVRHVESASTGAVAAQRSTVGASASLCRLPWTPVPLFARRLADVVTRSVALHCPCVSRVCPTVNLLGAARLNCSLPRSAGSAL